MGTESRSLRVLAILAATTGLACGSAATPKRVLQPADEALLPVQLVTWPRQLDNDLLAHVVESAGNASVLCGRRVADLALLVESASATARGYRLATGIAAMTSAALVGGAQLIDSDEARSDYTIIVAVGGSFVTGGLAALSEFNGSEDTLRRSARRMGEVGSAVHTFVEEWNALLSDDRYQDCVVRPQDGSIFEHGKVWVARRADNNPLAFEWKQRERKYAYGSYLSAPRCTLERKQQVKLQLELSLAIDRLMGACGSAADAIDVPEERPADEASAGDETGNENPPPPTPAPSAPPPAAAPITTPTPTPTPAPAPAPTTTPPAQ